MPAGGRSSLRVTYVYVREESIDWLEYVTGMDQDK